MEPILAGKGLLQLIGRDKSELEPRQSAFACRRLSLFLLCTRPISLSLNKKARDAGKIGNHHQIHILGFGVTKRFYLPAAEQFGGGYLSKLGRLYLASFIRAEIGRNFRLGLAERSSIMDCLQQAAIHKRDQLCTSVPDRTLNQISARVWVFALVKEADYRKSRKSQTGLSNFRSVL